MIVHAHITDEPADEITRAYMAHTTPGSLLFAQAIEALSKQIIHVESNVYRSEPLYTDLNTFYRGQRVFEKYGDMCLFILGHYSLPYCYASAEGSKVLFFSEKIRNQTFQRLRDTAHFVVQLMQKNTLQNGLFNQATARVRMRHALVRYFIHSKGGIAGNQHPPIHQEEMAGTLLAFSLLTVKGLMLCGFDLDAAEQEGYIRLWNEVGVRLGVLPELLPQNYSEACMLERHIRARHFAPSSEAKVLLKALIEVLNKNNRLPFFDPAEVMSFFLDETVCRILGLPKGNHTLNNLRMRAILKALHFWNNARMPHKTYSFEKELIT